MAAVEVATSATALAWVAINGLLVGGTIRCSVFETPARNRPVDGLACVYGCLRLNMPAPPILRGYSQSAA
jgi:hypothetical protein